MKISLNILSIYIKEMKGGAAGYSFRNQLRFLLLTHGLFVPALFKLAVTASVFVLTKASQCYLKSVSDMTLHAETQSKFREL